MEILYSSGKNQSNFIKHGVFLAEADKLEWNALIIEKNTRRNYGEDRMIGLAPIGERLFCVVFTDRDKFRRIISLRKANKREVKRYAHKN
jgi:uncharacterized DUF497 family protein